MKRPRTRVRQTDFHGIENPLQDTELSEFELEAREELACVPSPLDQMIEAEEELEQLKKEIQIKRRVRRHRKYASLSAKQFACLKLRHPERILRDRNKRTFKRIARKFGISTSSAWARYYRAKRKLEKLRLRQLEGHRIKTLITKPLYRAKLRNVFLLYFERLWPPTFVAKALRRSLASIYKNIRTLRWLAHAYSPREAARPVIFHDGTKKIVVSVKKPAKKPDLCVQIYRRRSGFLQPMLSS